MQVALHLEHQLQPARGFPADAHLRWTDPPELPDLQGAPTGGSRPGDDLGLSAVALGSHRVRRWGWMEAMEATHFKGLTL